MNNTHLTPGTQKTSLLALDHVFLIAMNFFDETHNNHHMDFFLSTNLMTHILERKDSEWDAILGQIQKILGDLYLLKIRGIAVTCRKSDGQLKLCFMDPGYHDLQLAEVSLIPQKEDIK